MTSMIAIYRRAIAYYQAGCPGLPATAEASQQLLAEVAAVLPAVSEWAGYTDLSDLTTRYCSNRGRNDAETVAYAKAAALDLLDDFDSRLAPMIAIADRRRPAEIGDAVRPEHFTTDEQWEIALGMESSHLAAGHLTSNPFRVAGREFLMMVSLVATPLAHAAKTARQRLTADEAMTYSTVSHSLGWVQHERNRLYSQYFSSSRNQLVAYRKKLRALVSTPESEPSLAP